MNKAVELVANGECDGVVSCGSTGAFLTLATLKVKLIPGVKRAALGTFFPTAKEGKYTLILDVGASNETNAEQLVQFAEIGECVYRNIYNILQNEEFADVIDEITDYLEQQFNELETLSVEIDGIREKHHKAAKEEISNKIKQHHKKKNN